MAKLQPKAASGKTELAKLERQQATELERERGRTSVRVVRARREVSLDAVGVERLRPAETPPPAPRVNRADVPKGTRWIPDVGLLESPLATNGKNHRAEFERWQRLADRVREALAPRGGGATPPAVALGPLPELPELAAMYTELYGWRRMLEIALKHAALARAHNRARLAPGRARAAIGEQKPFPGHATLAMLRAHDGSTPAGLTPEILDALIERVQLGERGGTRGGITIQRAIELAELAATDPKRCAREVLKRHPQK
jgi:hypothetical protein